MTTLLALFATEVGFRVLAHERGTETLESVLNADLSDRGRIGLIDIIRTHPNDKIIYELKPGLEAVPFKGAPVSTNRWGFRSEDIAFAEDSDAVTIVGIGDSLMFGHGVGDGECYLDVLLGTLRDEHPERDWRLINTGVPGYNTVMEVETLREKCLRFGPDLVILELVSNDLALPIYLREKQDVFDLTRSFTWAWVKERREESRLVRDPRLIHQQQALEMEHIPEQYRDMVGWEAFDRALDDLEELQREHGFELLVFHTFGGGNLKLMAESVEARGHEVVSLVPELTEYMRTGHGVERIDPPALLRTGLVVSEANLHPSVKHHRMAAEKIYAALVERGWIDEVDEP